MTTFWSNRQVLVTGATGLVGSWLCRALVERGATVVAFVRDLDPRSELCRGGTIGRIGVVEGEVEDQRAVERALAEHEIAIVFHLAAQTIVGTAQRSPQATFEANVRGTWNVLEACRRHRDLVEGIVVASSDKAYGSLDGDPYTEATPLRPKYPYEVSKACTDLIAQCYAQAYELPVTIARCGNIYGGGDLNWSRLVPGTIRSLLRGEAPRIRSNGHYVRDYIYVEDAVGGYLLLGEHAQRGDVRGRAFNFSPESPVKVLEMVARISAVVGRNDLKPVILDQAQGEIEIQWLRATAARESLRWSHQYSLETGLERTVKWYRDYPC